jgi:cytochrome P450
MTTDTLELREAPALELDPFADDYLLDPYPHHERLRAAGPVVRLPRYDCYASGRYAVVKAVLEDPATFCSGAGVGLTNFRKEPPWRVPSLVLETDPPDHTRNRAAIGRALSPLILRNLREGFQQEAHALVETLLQRGGAIEAVTELAEVFPVKVFADAVGLRKDQRRDNLIAYGNMVFNTMGPRNQHYANAMANAEAVAAWVWDACQRSALTPDGLGAKIFEAVDAGILNDQQGATLVRSFLSAGIDTTANAIGLALHCFALHPEQWDLLVADPELARGAFEEVLRFGSPFQTFFRTTTRETQIEGIRLAENEKILVSPGSANRDPAKWQRPDAFDIRRSAAGHLAFGAGIHGCVGQMMARLEVEVLLRALAARVKRIELAGEARIQPHNTLRGFAVLPVRLVS